MEKKKLALVATILLLVAISFTIVGEYVKTMEIPENAPQLFVDVIIVVQTFFTSTGAAMVVVLIRNFYGYARSYYSAKFDNEEIEYSTTKVAETIAIITPMVNIFAPVLDIYIPSFGTMIASAFAFGVSMIISETNRLKQPIKQPMLNLNDG